MNRVKALRKWLIPGMGIKRRLILLKIGAGLVTWSIISALLLIEESQLASSFVFGWLGIVAGVLVGSGFMSLALIQFSRSILAPYRSYSQKPVVDVVYTHSRRQKGLKVVAIGGGTGLPSTLKGMKAFTSNLTAVVTVADDGGSSGRLRRDLGVLPPGDIRNCMVALADVEPLMENLFQYRFNQGSELEGHSFGNLFIVAMSEVTGNFERALEESSRVLAVRGRVLPSTLSDVTLCAETDDAVTVQGESSISAAGHKIRRV